MSDGEETDELLYTEETHQQVMELMDQLRALIEAHNARSGAPQIDDASIMLRLPEYGDMLIKHDLISREHGSLFLGCAT